MVNILLFPDRFAAFISFQVIGNQLVQIVSLLSTGTVILKLVM